MMNDVRHRLRFRQTSPKNRQRSGLVEILYVSDRMVINITKSFRVSVPKLDTRRDLAGDRGVSPDCA